MDSLEHLNKLIDEAEFNMRMCKEIVRSGFKNYDTDQIQRGANGWNVNYLAHNHLITERMRLKAYNNLFDIRSDAA